MSSLDAWREASKVLCVRLDTIGDILMTTPAMRALNESSLGRSLTLLTSTAGSAIAPLVPDVDAVITYDAPWMKSTGPHADSAPEHALIQRLRRESFDAAVIFTVYSQSPLPAALLCHLAGIPLRLAHCHENPYGLLSTWLPDPEPERLVRHEVRRQLDLVAAGGCFTADERLSLRLPGGSVDRVRRVLRKHGVDVSRPWLLIHPGATAPSRRYPPESFAVVARLLAQDGGYQVLFTGTALEHKLIASIQSQAAIFSFNPAGDVNPAGIFNLAGALHLGELAALIAHAPVLITNNTGPAHIAAAVGTPVVDIYALTNPQHVPWQVPHRVLSHDVPCKYCYKSTCPEGHHHCLRLIRPARVVRATFSLLAETAASHGARRGVFA
ncbi:MAG: lipopolysaccharide heptosyltransferase [Chloroflexi bacterium]|nr:lipopolysaccharide heptosyltransferase [Chloroflexota bacterium]